MENNRKVTAFCAAVVIAFGSLAVAGSILTQSWWPLLAFALSLAALVLLSALQALVFVPLFELVWWLNGRRAKKGTSDNRNPSQGNQPTPLPRRG